MQRPALQSKRVGVLRMAFRARKVFGSFEKRTPGPSCPKPGYQKPVLTNLETYRFQCFLSNGWRERSFKAKDCSRDPEPLQMQSVNGIQYPC